MPTAPSALAATVVTGEGPSARHLVMLHGIYGRGRNWQAIARGVTRERPEYSCWLVDLPHHGISPPGAHDDTVSGLAADVDAWLTAQNLTPDALLGHSYGGKVALALAAHRADRPLQVWVVDSTPESKAPGGSAWDMLRVVRELPETFASREEAADAIAHAGFSLGVAQWMTTNLERQSGRFAWRLDFDVMERLLHDFFTADFWHVVDPPAAGHVVHVIKASESSVISPEALARLEQQESRVQVHHRAGGHWIHAESPEVITALLTQYLP